MGSVQDIIDCPMCGDNEAIETIYYKTNEFEINCLRCGYNKSNLIINLDQIKIDLHWIPVYKRVINKNGVAFRYKIKGQNHFVRAGSKRNKLNQIISFVKQNKNYLATAEINFKKYGKWVTIDLLKEEEKSILQAMPNL